MVAELFEESLEESAFSDDEHIQGSIHKLDPAPSVSTASITSSAVIAAATTPVGSLATITSISNIGASRSIRADRGEEQEPGSKDWGGPDDRPHSYQPMTSARKHPGPIHQRHQIRGFSADSESEGEVEDDFDAAESSQHLRFESTQLSLTQEELELQQQRQLEELQRKQLEQLQELQRMQKEQQLALQKAHTRLAVQHRSLVDDDTDRGDHNPRERSRTSKTMLDVYKQDRHPHPNAHRNEKVRRHTSSFVEPRQPLPKSMSPSPIRESQIRRNEGGHTSRSNHARAHPSNSSISICSVPHDILDNLDQDDLRQHKSATRRAPLEPLQQQQQQQLENKCGIDSSLDEKRRLQLQKQEHRQRQQQKLQQNQQKEQELLRRQRQLEQHQLQRKQLLLRLQEQQSQQEEQQFQGQEKQQPSRNATRLQNRPHPSSVLSPALARPTAATAERSSKPSSIVGSTVVTPKKKKPLNPVQKAPGTENILASARTPDILRSTLTAAGPALSTAKNVLLGSKRMHSVFEDKENFATPHSSLLRKDRSNASGNSNLCHGQPIHSPKVYKRQRPTTTWMAKDPAPMALVSRSNTVTSIASTISDPLAIAAAAASPSLAPLLASSPARPVPPLVHSASADFAAALVSPPPALTTSLPTDTSASVQMQTNKDFMNCFDQWMSDLGSEDVMGFSLNSNAGAQPAYNLETAGLVTSNPTVRELSCQVTAQSGAEDDVGTGGQSELDDEAELDESEIDRLLYSEVGDDYGPYGVGGQGYVSTPGSEIGGRGHNGDLTSDPVTSDLYDWFPETVQNSVAVTVAEPYEAAAGVVTEQHLSLLSMDPTLSSSPAELAYGSDLGLEFDTTGDPLWLQQELQLQQQQQHQQQDPQESQLSEDQQQDLAEQLQQLQEQSQIEEFGSSRAGTPQLDSTDSTLLSSTLSDVLSPTRILAQSHHYIPMGPGGQFLPVGEQEYVDHFESEPIHGNSKHAALAALYTSL
ncbi:hypothetical protein BC939DRAFT_481479 [Gamsiella multidivaricata]|uniref:uncharacterized protein n=1 Tax=Gamsiella multidivaricata TaxID=101098 RepID=UPI002220B3CB|nr:uncharacterized protein BC939DRAFT_481479 [Gamsiella multidivaricata]KAI7817105.1 hypothetical protein BC939DRAFT_481479 [Gamsiella multidivaricata]